MVPYLFSPKDACRKHYHQHQQCPRHNSYPNPPHLKTRPFWFALQPFKHNLRCFTCEFILHCTHAPCVSFLHPKSGQIFPAEINLQICSSAGLKVFFHIRAKLSHFSNPPGFPLRPPSSRSSLFNLCPKFSHLSGARRIWSSVCEERFTNEPALLWTTLWRWIVCANRFARSKLYRHACLSSFDHFAILFSTNTSWTWVYGHDLPREKCWVQNCSLTGAFLCRVWLFCMGFLMGALVSSSSPKTRKLGQLTSLNCLWVWVVFRLCVIPAIDRYPASWFCWDWFHLPNAP